MSHQKTLLLMALLSACAASHGANLAKASFGQCVTAQEKERLLALDENAFDQDLSGGGGGWRAIAAKEGCDIAAADIIRDYREKHASTGHVITWHEGQLRAMGGDDKAAIALFGKSRVPEEKNGRGWNQYVDASIAFLEKDKPALMRARESLAGIPVPPNVALKDGVFEVPNNSGTPFKMRWPPNIDVVDGLIQCFEKGYRNAYGDAACRPAPPK